MKEQKEQDDFFSNPKILNHYELLQELGVFSYIEALKKEIRDHESIIKVGIDIFHQTTIDDILETTVQHISDKLIPTHLIFLWRQSIIRPDLMVRGYQNFKPIDVTLDVPGLAPFEEFFLKYPRPISFELFEFQLGKPVKTAPLKAYDPEIIVPIIGPSGLYGIILVGSKVLEGQYSLQELAYLDQLITFASLAIQNHIHYEFSLRDPKTGLYNHGYFMTRLQDEISRSQRQGYTFSIVVMDVDNFKSFNDTYGHIAGDTILEGIAETIKEQIRIQDIPSRFGGEEFTVLLPETSRANAWLVAERLRNAISHLKVDWNPPLPQITVSAGVATCEPTTILTTSEEILKRADEALYQSKQRGKNRTTTWGAGLLFKTQQKIGAEQPTGYVHNL